MLDLEGSIPRIHTEETLVHSLGQACRVYRRVALQYSSLDLMRRYSMMKLKFHSVRFLQR